MVHIEWYVPIGWVIQDSPGSNFSKLVGEVEFLDVWQDSYAAVMRYDRAMDGFWVRYDLTFTSGSHNRHFSTAVPTFIRFVCP